MSSDESDDDDDDNVTRSQPSSNAAAAADTAVPSKISNGTSSTHATESSSNDKKSGDMTTCVHYSPFSSKQDVNDAPYDDILEDLFGPYDGNPQDSGLAKEKNEKESASGGKSSKSRQAKTSDAPSSKSSAPASNNVDCEMNSVQSPDSGFVDGPDAGVDDVKPPRPSGSEESSASKEKKKKKKALKRVESIMGEVGRVSPLLSPVREFPPLMYLPPPDGSFLRSRPYLSRRSRRTLRHSPSKPNPNLSSP